MPYADPDKQKAYARSWIAARRATWFAENGPCVTCGSWERLELDHADPALKVHHAIWSWARERREAELAKCQALCRTCHQAKTVAENHARFGTRGHGHRKTYEKGCRCEPCTLANRERRARQRAARRLTS